MAKGPVRLRTRVLHLLIDAGTWVGRTELNTLTACMPALDDVLADLVTEGLLEHRKNVGYRLAASEAVRRAAQNQRRSGKAAEAVGMPGAGFYSLGVAEVRPETGLLLYELQLPNPEPGPNALGQFRAQLQGILEFKKPQGGQHA